MNVEDFLDILIDFWGHVAGGGSKVAFFGLSNALLGFRGSGALYGHQAIARLEGGGSGKSKWGLSNGGLRPLSAICAHLCAIVHFRGLS